jgi:two-component system sensor histidine kinase CpxA
MMKMGRLFVRVFLWFWLGSSGLLLVLALTFAWALPDTVATWRFIGRTAMQHLGSQMANAFERQGVDAAEAVVAEAGQEGLRVWLFSPDGRHLAGPEPPVMSAGMLERMSSEIGSRRFGFVDPPLLARPIVSDAGTAYTVVWDAPRALRTAFRLSRGQFAAGVVALLLLEGAICWLLVWQIAKPIRTLQAAARRFADGDLSVRVAGHRELRRGDELSELAGEFDRMAARIQELILSQQQLLADISHELRSPLARLSMALALARRRTGDDVPEHERIEHEVQRLDELIEQLLTLARLQGRYDQPFEPVDLAELLNENVRDAAFEAQASGRGVELSARCRPTVRGSRHLLRSAIENVVRNAVRHTREQTTVSIVLECDHETGRAAIVVRDRGPGVPDEALERLFDPFFRVDTARDRERGGVGLGLAITKQAMSAHAGTARASNHPEGGLVVRLELPVDGADNGKERREGSH